MECYTLWQEFKQSVDERLDIFLAAELPGISQDSLTESLQRVQQYDQGLLSCIDYLMAASDYLDFTNLMLDFKEVAEVELEN